MVPLRTRLIRILAALVVLGGALAAAFMVPSGSSALVPRDPVELGKRIVVDGDPATLNGKLDLVGVGDNPLSIAERLLYEFRDDVAIVQDIRSERDDEVDELRMERSKEVSAALAMEKAGLAVRISGSGALVELVDEQGPSQGLLQRDDRIISVNGVSIDTAAELTDRVSRVPAGSVVRLGVRRDQLPKLVRIKTVATDIAGRKSKIGINVSTPDLEIDLPRKVRIDSNGVIGPSAGLVFALGVYDAVTQQDLLKGRHIAATGEIALTGDVIPVGGIKQKAIGAHRAGAELLIVPSTNAEAALAGVQIACEPDSGPCMEILPVDTFEEAAERLQLRSDELEPYLAR